MKRLVSNPKFGSGEYYYEDPFSSSLQIMQEKCTSLLRPSWNKTDLVIPVDYQQLFKQQSDLDIKQFEQKYLPQDAIDNKVKFTPTLPKLDDMSVLEFSELWEFSPEVLSTKDLQISKCEPFVNLIYEEASPPNSFYEGSKQIPSQPLQFDDPLKMNPLPLLPSISAENLAPQACLSLGNLKLTLKDIAYPETPSCDYLFDLARQVHDLNIVTDMEAPENTMNNPCKGVNEKQKEHFLVADTRNANSEVPLTNIQSVGEEFSLTPKRIIAELPSFAINSVKLMEAHLFACLQILKETNLPLIEDLLKESSPLAKLHPNMTRSCLLKLQEEINSTKLDPGQDHNEKILRQILPTLLSLHGVNKGLDLFLNIDYEIAYGTLANFEKTHEAVLKGDYKSLIMQLLRLRPKKLEEWHPKLVELKRIVTSQLSEEKSNRRIWIRLYRHSNELAERIERLFADIGIQCEVDRQLGCPESTLFLPSGSYPIIVAEKVSENFPPSLLSLIVHYEWSSTWPMETHWQSASITQMAIEINRPVFVEPQSIPDQEICPVPISTPTRHQVSSPSKEVDSSVEDESDACMENESNVYDEKCLTNFTEEPHLSIQNETGIESLDEFHTSCKIHIEEEQNMERGLSQSPNKDGIHVNSPASVMQSNTDKSSFNGSTDSTVPVIVSSHLKNNLELMEAIEADGNLFVYDCDYEFLGYSAKYQPDALINAGTALIIVQEQEKFEETRLRILTASLKCTKCWIVLLAPGVINSSKPPVQWHSLAGLVRFYEKKHRKRSETRFHLKLRIAVNYHQVAFIMKDVAEDEITQDIESHLQPLNDDAKSLLHFPQLNAVTASLIAQHFSAKELLTLPVETLCNRLPSLRQRIKIVRFSRDTNNEEHEVRIEDVEENSSFGHLKDAQPWHLDPESLEECGSRRLPTPKKRAKLDSDHPEEMGTPFSASQLRDMWCSPSPTRPV